MGCCRCCTKANATCRKVMEPLFAILRVLENVPVLGHLIASLYACSSCKARAERAGLKATVGLALAVCSCPAEAVDELVRHREPKLISHTLRQRSDWMKRHQRRTLRHLCLPASHQSATYKMTAKLQQIPMVEGWSRCQDLDIDHQLYGGVRLLDLRVMTYKGEVWTHHQKVICERLKEVLEVVRDFVVENPSEVLVLYITNDGKDVQWMNVHSLLNEHLGKKLIPEHMREMAIGDITQYGKNVVVAGIPNVAYSWRGIDYRWPNKSTPAEVELDMQKTIVEFSEFNPHFMFWYKMECTVDTLTTVRALGGLPSVCVARCTTEKFDFLEDVAASVNHRLLRLLRASSRIPFNVISTDFVNDEIIERILAMNDLEQTGAGPMVVREVLAGSRDNLLTDIRVNSYIRTSDSMDRASGTLDRMSERTSADTSMMSSRGGMLSIDMSMTSAEQQPLTQVWESVM